MRLSPFSVPSRRRRDSRPTRFSHFLAAVILIALPFKPLILFLNLLQTLARRQFRAALGLLLGLERFLLDPGALDGLAFRGTGRDRLRWIVSLRPSRFPRRPRLGLRDTGLSRRALRWIMLVSRRGDVGEARLSPRFLGNAFA